jgi:hypothetical protein
LSVNNGHLAHHCRSTGLLPHRDRPECGGRTKPVSHRNPDRPASQCSARSGRPDEWPIDPHILDGLRAAEICTISVSRTNCTDHPNIPANLRGSLPNAPTPNRRAPGVIEGRASLSKPRARCLGDNPWAIPQPAHKRRPGHTMLFRNKIADFLCLFYFRFVSDQGRKTMSWNEYDPESLTERARHWRLVATSAIHESMRVFCLEQAKRCDRRVQASINTPVLRHMSEPVL